MELNMGPTENGGKPARVPFVKIATDILHCIFESTLGLGHIHDPDIPLDALAKHRGQLFRLRSVCSNWNKLFLSCPRYWCVIDIGAPQAAAVRAIERAGSAPLCICSAESKNWTNVQSDQVQAMLETRLEQIRTLRLNDKAFYSFGRSLIRRGLANLQTLEIVADPFHYREDGRADELPRLRHLTSRCWRPPSDPMWLAELRTLDLRGMGHLSPELYRVLASCSNLRKFLLQLDDPSASRRLPDVPPVLSFPQMTEFELDIADKHTAVNLMRRINSQISSSGLLRVHDMRISDYGIILELFHLLTGGEQVIRPALPTSFEIRGGGWMTATYRAGNRSLNFEVLLPSGGDGNGGLRRLLEAFNQQLDNPPIDITIREPNSSHTELLRSFISSNVRKLHIIGTWSFQEDLRRLLQTIGTSPSLNPTRICTAKSTINYIEEFPFKNLRFLIIESVAGRARVNLNDVVWMITAGGQRRVGSGSWLEEVTLIHCTLEGMPVSDAVTRLLTFGIRMSIRT